MNSKKLYLWESLTINTTYLRQLRQFFLFSAEIRFDKFITGHPFLKNCFKSNRIFEFRQLYFLIFYLLF